MIEIHDNALEPHVAELIDMQLRDISWKYNYDSVKNGVNKHWHVLCGHNTDDCYDNGYDYLIAIWNVIKKHIIKINTFITFHNILRLINNTFSI